MSTGNEQQTVERAVSAESDPLEFKARQELARLEEGLPQMMQQRNAMNEQILRVEGGILTLRAMLVDKGETEPKE